MSHTHLIKDADTSFTIDPITRKIISSSSKFSLMQYDHDSEIFTFQIPKLVEGHDMSLCNKIEIHYTNINKKTKEASSDVYPVTDATVINGDNLIFSWLISGNATKHPGSLIFLIRFGCLEDNNVFSYLWHTDIFKNITILDGMSNTEVVAEDYSDILEQWRSEINAKFALKTEVYTKSESDERFALKTDAYTKSESDAKFALKTDAYTKPESDKLFALKTDAYTKSESDAKFALIEDIPSAVTDDHINSLIDAKLGAIENGSY